MSLTRLVPPAIDETPPPTLTRKYGPVVAPIPQCVEKCENGDSSDADHRHVLEEEAEPFGGPVQRLFVLGHVGGQIVSSVK